MSDIKYGVPVNRGGGAVGRSTLLAAESTVRRNAASVAEARELFEMLGLVEAGGRDLALPPEDPWAGGARPAPDDGVVLHELTPGRTTTTPAALRDLPAVRPAPLPPTTESTPGRRGRPACGSPGPGGYNAHKRRGEDSCELCREAYNHSRRVRRGRAA